MFRGLTTPRLLAGSFLATILAGTALLKLPFAMHSQVPQLTLVDALFTSTSAVCVTGLAVRDTGTEFTWFGQAIILLLIQAGGLGILTLGNAIFLLRGGSLGLRERSVMHETVGIHRDLSPKKLLWRIFLFTFACEGIGAAILSVHFANQFPVGYAIWLGVFHSVSAFCNAGFGLFTDSLIQYRTDPVVNFTIMALIILGGLGFFVAADLMTSLRNPRLRRFRRVSFHSRVVIRTTIILILSGWLVFFVLGMLHPERSRMSGLALETLFLSVTARTAGFNSINMVDLSNAGLIFLMLLMIIGGSPGSTAGGIKTTTAATLYALIRSRARNRPKVELLDRSIPHVVQAKAFASAAMYIGLVIGAVMLLEITENLGRPHASSATNFMPHLFEVVSALATVGLSTGITAKVTVEGKLVLILCMFIGRLGTLLVASSLVGVQRRLDYSYPEERLLVG